MRQAAGLPATRQADRGPGAGQPVRTARAQMPPLAHSDVLAFLRATGARTGLGRQSGSSADLARDTSFHVKREHWTDPDTRRLAAAAECFVRGGVTRGLIAATRCPRCGPLMDAHATRDGRDAVESVSRGTTVGAAREPRTAGGNRGLALA